MQNKKVTKKFDQAKFLQKFDIIECQVIVKRLPKTNDPNLHPTINMCLQPAATSTTNSHQSICDLIKKSSTTQSFSSINDITASPEFTLLYAGDLANSTNLNNSLLPQSNLKKESECDPSEEENSSIYATPPNVSPNRNLLFTNNIDININNFSDEIMYDPFAPHLNIKNEESDQEEDEQQRNLLAELLAEQRIISQQHSVFRKYCEGF